jgi:hypothetical protein
LEKRAKQKFSFPFTFKKWGAEKNEKIAKKNFLFCVRRGERGDGVWHYHARGA